MTDTAPAPEPTPQRSDKPRLRDHLDLKLTLWGIVVVSCGLLLALFTWELSDDIGSGPRAQPEGLRTAVVRFEDGRTAYCVHDTFALTCWPDGADLAPQSSD